MKIERLTKENIREFIMDMELGNNLDIEKKINSGEYFGIKDEEKFILGFDTLSDDDRIAIIYYGSKINNDKYLECIKFLKDNIVVKNHLIIEVFNNKYMELSDSLYRCREVFMYLKVNDYDENFPMKEKYAEVDMMSIRYYYSKSEIVCNLVKQNIQNENVILRLDEYFKGLDTGNINFIIYSDSYEIFKNLGYLCLRKSYVV